MNIEQQFGFNERPSLDLTMEKIFNESKKTKEKVKKNTDVTNS